MIAKNSTEALYPRLWDKLVGYYSPTSGRQGMRLYDRAPRPNPAVLTNMAQDDWVGSRIGLLIDYDNSDDRAIITAPRWTAVAQSRLSVSAWAFRRHNSTSTCGIFSIGTNINDQISIILSGATAGADDIIVRVSQGANSIGHTTGNVIPLNTLFHVAFVFDGTQADNATRLKIYVNSRPQTLTFVGTIPAATSTSMAGDLLIGRSTTGPASWDGRIGDIGIWTRVLEHREIIQLFQNKSPLDLAA